MNALDSKVAGMLEGRTGPNALADKIRDRLDDLGAAWDEATTRAERSSINKEIHRLKDWLRWCETRAGYVAE